MNWGLPMMNIMHIIKMKSRRSMKKIGLILCICVIGCTIFLVWKGSTRKKEIINPYVEKGYSLEMANRIENLSEENKNYLLEEDYLENLGSYLDASEFQESHLQTYIHFSKTHGLSLEDTIYIVNHSYDDLETYDEKTIALMHRAYYIHEYLERYLSYQGVTGSSIEEYDAIITAVNSNLDYEFYTLDYTVNFDNPYLILVNKYYKLSSDYVPDNLVTIEAQYGKTLLLESTVYEQYKKMWNDAKQQGLSLYICSPYRSYTTQQGLYNRYVSQDGKKAADTYSARPGYSEHQTGLAFDVITPTTNFDTFASTKEFAWLQEHAHEYGFILRYPKGKEYITGYIYEPWHYRYVGVEVATQIYETGLTYEEYYAYYVR